MTETITTLGQIENSLLIKTYKGIKSEKIPLWFMRQAGRYLPEYRELRKQNSMLELIRSPKLAAEVTLQPLRRFSFNGSIIFADILNPLIGMGMNLEFVEGEGPKIFNLLKSDSDVNKLLVPSPLENIPYTLEAINLVANEIAKKGIPLLGFCGAPFTLASYMIASNPSQRIKEVLNFANLFPQSWKDLQAKLAELVTTHLLAQVAAGAAAAQIFDTWVGNLSLSEFNVLVKPSLIEIVKNYKKSCQAPLIYFGRSTEHLYPELAQLGFDVLGVDWQTSIQKAATLIDKPMTLQGNLSPDILAGPKDALETEVYKVLEDGKHAHAHVFNLGHGVLPHTPIENVQMVCELVNKFRIQRS